MRAEAKVVIGCVLGMVLCVVLAACDKEFAWVSTLGIKMAFDEPLDSWMTPQNADEMGMQLLGGLADRGLQLGRAAECLAHVTIISYPEPFHCGAERCNGVEIAAQLPIVVTQCPWASTFRHEAAHWLQDCVLNVYDPNHEEKWVWEVADAFVPCETGP